MQNNFFGGAGAMIFFLSTNFIDKKIEKKDVKNIKFQLMLIFINRQHPIIDTEDKVKISVINLKKYEVYCSILLLIDYLPQFNLVDTDIPSHHLLINRKA
jgi:hypothetical protein